MIEFLLSVAFSWFLVTFIHEFAHLFAAYFVDDIKPAGIHLLPHWAKFSEYGWKRRLWRPWELNKKPEGYDQFYFASYSVQGSLPLGPNEPIHVAPLIVDFACMVTMGVYYVINGGILPAVLTAAFLVDAWVWFYGYIFGGEHTDGKRYRYGIR